MNPEQPQREILQPRNLLDEFEGVEEPVTPAPPVVEVVVPVQDSNKELLGAIANMGQQLVNQISALALVVAKSATPDPRPVLYNSLETNRFVDRSIYPEPYPPQSQARPAGGMAQPPSHQVYPPQPPPSNSWEMMQAPLPPHFYQTPAVNHPGFLPPRDPFTAASVGQQPLFPLQQQYSYPPPPYPYASYPSFPGAYPGNFSANERSSNFPLGSSKKRPLPSEFEEGMAVLSKLGQEALTDEILMEPNPPFFKNPKNSLYYGLSDPVDHVGTFQDELTTFTISDAMRCKLFLMTLKGEARQWFSTLPRKSVYCFTQFVTMFLGHFSSARKPKRSTDVLHAVKQGPNETLREYVLRFLAI